MGRLRSLLASLRDGDDPGGTDSPITTLLRVSRAQSSVAAAGPEHGSDFFLRRANAASRSGSALARQVWHTPQRPAPLEVSSSDGSPPIRASPRSAGAIHELAEGLVDDLAVNAALNHALKKWATAARVARQRQIGTEWWTHAAAASTMLQWWRHARHERRLGAAWREALWTAARHSLTHWRLSLGMRRVTGRLDELGRCVFALRCWRAGVRARRAMRLGRLTGDALRAAQCLRCWTQRSRQLETRRIYYDGRMQSATAAVGRRHARAVALSSVLSLWRLGALRAHLVAMDDERAWQPVVRAALRLWAGRAASDGRSQRAIDQFRRGGVALACACALRTWRGVVARGPQRTLVWERTQIGKLVIAWERWRRRTYVGGCWLGGRRWNTPRVSLEGAHYEARAPLVGLGARDSPGVVVDADASALAGNARRSWQQQQLMMGRRRPRSAAMRAAAARAAPDHARRTTQERAWRAWQLRRIERSLARYAAVRRMDVACSQALARWCEAASVGALDAELRQLAAATADSIAYQQGWASLLVWQRGSRVSARAVALRHAHHSRALMRAMGLWRVRSGLVRWPALHAALRCYEVTRALLLLFRWRDWVEAAFMRRAGHLFALALPQLLVLRRWRARALRRWRHAQLMLTAASRPRQRRLPFTWQRWLTHRIERGHACRLIELADARADRSRVIRSLRAIGAEVAWRRALRHGAACAARRALWRAFRRWVGISSREIAAAAGALSMQPGMPPVPLPVASALRCARGFNEWRRRHTSVLTRAAQARAARHAAWRAALRRGWCAICTSAVRDRVGARARTVLTDRAMRMAVHRWCGHWRHQLVATAVHTAWRRRTVRGALAVMHARGSRAATRAPTLVALALRQRRRRLHEGMQDLREGCDSAAEAMRIAHTAVARARARRIRRGLSCIQKDAQQRTQLDFLTALAAFDDRVTFAPAPHSRPRPPRPPPVGMENVWPSNMCPPSPAVRCASSGGACSPSQEASRTGCRVSGPDGGRACGGIPMYAWASAPLCVDRGGSPCAKEGVQTHARATDDAWPPSPPRAMPMLPPMAPRPTLMEGARRADRDCTSQPLAAALLPVPSGTAAQNGVGTGRAAADAATPTPRPQTACDDAQFARGPRALQAAVLPTPGTLPSTASLRPSRASSPAVRGRSTSGVSPSPAWLQQVWRRAV